MNNNMNVQMNRRNFLQMMGALGAGTALGSCTNSSSQTKTTVGAPVATTTLRAPGSSAPKPATGFGNRSLVVIEMGGGNDGLTTVVPHGLAGFGALRTSVVLKPEELLSLDANVGLHPNLKALHARGIAVVQGVGVAKPDGSHFDMSARWWAGDPDGKGTYPTGIFGRIADVIGDDSPAVAIALNGVSQSIITARATSISLSDPNAGDFLTNNDKGQYDAFQAGFNGMANGARTDTPIMAAARKGLLDASHFARHLGALPDVTEGYPGHELAQSLAMAARLLSANIGTRIIHVNHGQNFDTHENHLDHHANNMTALDESVDAFLRDLEARGLADKVLVMTTSEFGRRATDNGSTGLDHGAASVALLMGAVKPGLYGQYSSLTKLDDNENLMATTNMIDYYGTVAQDWFGVHATDVLEGSPTVIPGMFAAV